MSLDPARRAAPARLVAALLVALAATSCSAWQKVGTTLAPGERVLASERPVVRGGATLRVRIEDARAGVPVRTLLFGSEDGFPHFDAALDAVRVLPGSMPAEVVFSDLPPGRYAVLAFEDVDDDAQLGRSWAVAPSERWGCSGHAAGRGAPPRWERAAVSLPPAGLELSIYLGALPGPAAAAGPTALNVR